MKYTNTFSVFCFVLLFACCTSKQPKLSINQVKVLLWDLTLADNLYQQQQFRDSNLKHTNLQQKYYQRVFETHKVMQRDFLKAYSYYKEHPVMLKILLDSVDNFGSRQKNKRFETK